MSLALIPTLRTFHIIYNRSFCNYINNFLTIKTFILLTDKILGFRISAWLFNNIKKHSAKFLISSVYCICIVSYLTWMSCCSNDSPAFHWKLLVRSLVSTTFVNFICSFAKSLCSCNIILSSSFPWTSLLYLII